MTKALPIEPWYSKPQGHAPYHVVAFELPERGMRVYLRHYVRGTVKKRMVRDERGKGLLLRTSSGKPIEARKEYAIQAALEWSRHLSDTAGAGAVPVMTARPLTLAEGRKLAFDSKAGRYPTDTPHRREIERALVFAEAVWGAEGITTWEALRKRHLVVLWRARINQLLKLKKHGYRAAEITVVRVLSVAAWLRADEYLPAHVAHFTGDWRADMKRDWMELSGSHAEPTPERPRHTLDEMRRIMAAARQVDPRFELILALGAEQRLGQVLRARRGAINLDHVTFTIPGRGKKKGAVVELTDGQLAVVKRALTTGYLSALERSQLDPDYPLFPGTQLADGRKGQPMAIERHLTAPPISRQRTLREWFMEAERIAKVPYVKGRGAYGLRRRAVDAAMDEGISESGLQAAGGWMNSKIPHEVYAEQNRAKDRREARDIRAKIRGEVE